ncbi:helix-turn-helix domain-containing protein [Sphingomonas sp.]|uniref:TetR/AcrR family transcriptional regulator n=1 Tax=Sphingomonas sp. TaxID=28214 RepID=UPI0031D5A803
MSHWADRTVRLERRRRRPGAQLRREALDAARWLLVQGGPGAVTIANVAERIDASRTALLYHFGSAATLQSTLTRTIITELAMGFGRTASGVRSDAEAQSSLPAHIFDLFDEAAAGQAAAWTVLAGDGAQLEPLREAVRALAAALDGEVGRTGADRPSAQLVYLLTIGAFGDAVIGPYLREMLNLPTGTMRAQMARILSELPVTRS